MNSTEVLLTDREKELSIQLGIPECFYSLLVEDGVDEDGCVCLKDSKGEIFRILKNPAIAYDSDGFIIMKYGEVNEVMKYVERATRVLRGTNILACQKMADDLTMVELHKNQQLLDKLFNTTGYLELYINRCKQLQEAGYQWENKQKDMEETK